ncbi:hypothetical protein ABPG73_001219 [Tetrahymena malaccensis]
MVFYTIFGCQDGCLVCNQDEKEENCSLCIDGYNFNILSSKCEKSTCEQYQYISNQSNVSNCVSLCQNNYIPQQSNQSCQQATTCPIQYIQPTQISQGRNITDVFLHEKGYLIAIYNNFFSYFELQTGNYIRSQTFNSSIQTILRLNQTIYLLSDQNQVFEWIEDTAQQKFLLKIQLGRLSTYSNFISVMNQLTDDQKNLVFISSYQNLNNIIYFTGLNSQNQSFQITYPNYAFLSNNYILLQNSNYSIQMANFQIIDNQIQIKNLFNNYMCQGINGIFVQMITIQIQQQQYFAITFAQTNGFIILTQQNQSCQILYQNYQQPLKIQLVPIYQADQNIYLQFLAILFNGSQTMYFYDTNQKQNDFQYNLTAQSVDFIQFTLNISIQKLYTLNINQQLDSYELKYNSQNQNVTINQINTQPLYINSPSQLMLIQNLTISDKLILCVVSQEIQIIDLVIDQSIGVTTSFVEKQNYATNQINSINYDENSNLVLSCSKDGKIIVWNMLDPLKPIFYSQISISNQQCLQVLLLKSQVGVGLLSKSIILFNVYNSNINQIIQINPNYYSNILVQGTQIFLIYNQQISVWTDLTQSIVTQNFTQTVKYSYVSQRLRVYMMDSKFNMIFYDFDPNLKSFKVSQITQLGIKSLVYSFLFNLQTSSGCLLMFTNQQNQLFIFDQDLQLLYQPYQFIGNKTVHMYQQDDNTYFILMYAPLYDQGYPYFTSSISLNTTIQFTHYYDLIIGSQILNVAWYQQPFPFVKIIMLQPQSPTSTFGEGRFYTQTQGQQRAKKIQTPNDQISKCVTNGQKTVYVAGSTSGSLIAIPENKNSYIQQVFQMPNLVSGDSLQAIQQNFNLGLIYYVSNYYVFTYSLHTQQFYSRLDFVISQQNVTSSNKIQQTQVYQSPNLVLAFSNQLLLLKNEDTQLSYQISTNNQSSQLTYINGCVYDQQSNTILVYGNAFFQFTLDLTQHTILSQPNQQNFQACLFQSSVIICQMNSNQIIIFNKLQKFQIVQIIQITSFQTFSIIGDELYQYILVYSNNIEVYSFDGIYLQRISSISSNIFQLIMTKQYVITFTSLGAFIFTRQSLVQAASFQPPGATLVKGFYFPEINTLAYITNEIRYGQVKFYSLDTLQSTGSVLSTFPELGIGTLINIFYDQANSAFVFVDTYGNFYYTLYGSQLYVFNVIGIYEFEQQLISVPIDFIADFRTNQMYIFNQNSVWISYYNLLIKTGKKMIQSNYKYFFSLQSNQDNNQLIYCDQNNKIFYYQNQIVKFLSQQQQNIIDMRNFYYNNTQIYTISTQDYINVYQNLNLSNLSQPAYQINISLRQYVLIDQSIILIQTVSNQIIDFDFINNKVLQQIQLPTSSLITSKLNVTTTNGTYYLFLSVSTGAIIRIDLTQKQFIINQSIVQNDIVQQIVKFIQEQIILITKTGNLIVIDINTLQKLDLQINNDILSNINSQNDLKINQIQYFDIDQLNNRYFISIYSENKLGVYKLSDNSLIKYLAFPDVQFKKVEKTKKFIILSSQFQLNIYNQQLQYLNFIRRSNQYQIAKIVVITDNILLITYLQQLEIVLINENTGFINSINQVKFTYPKLASFNINSNQQLQILILHQTGVYEEIISLNYLQQQMNNSSNSNQVCQYQMQYTSAQQMQAQFSNIYSFQNSQPTNYYFSVLVDNQINNLSFLSQNNIQYILSPQNEQENQLSLTQNSFQYIQSNANLYNFNLIFANQGAQYTFSQQSNIIILENCNIQDQIIMQGTSILFQNVQQIQILNMNISNISLVSNMSSVSGQQQQLFQFQNCSYILIENLLISNLTQQTGNQELMIFQNIDKIIFLNVMIKDSYISNTLLNLIQINLLRIQNFTITNCKNILDQENQKSNRLLQQQIIQFYLINLQGINLSQIIKFIAFNNSDLGLIQSNRQYITNQYTTTLALDQLFILQSAIYQNVFPKQFNNDIQNNLLSIISSDVQIDSMEFNNNQGNVIIENTDLVGINNSEFNNNAGIEGSCIQLIQINKNLIIQNSQFLNNVAQASGGSIYLLDTDNITIDQSTQFRNNSAQIGGAIRILYSEQKPFTQLYNFKNISAQFDGNRGQIYGNNLGTYPFQYLIFQGNNTGGKSLIYTGQLFNQDQNNLILQNIQSGGSIKLFLQLQDQYNQRVIINKYQFINNLYSQNIIQELQKYSFEILSNSTNDTIEIKGDSISNLYSYDQISNSFLFDNLQISGFPLYQIDSSLFYVKVNDWQQNITLRMTSIFRNCIKGEFYYQVSKNIINCVQCNNQTYSLLDPIDATNITIYDKLQQNISNFMCKKCPEGSQSCYSDVIILQSGYWREDSESDQIFQCNQIKPEICDPIQKNGCIQGHIGPLCETCDYFGLNQKGKRYSQSISTIDCSECSSDILQLFFVLLLLSLLLVYLSLSTIIFIKQYVYTCTLTYLRLLKTVPFSNSCIQDQSNFVIKTLINYFQISAILISLNYQLIPSALNIIPLYTGSPVTSVVLNGQCLYKYIGSSISSQNDLPNTIAFFVSSLSCRQIGNKQYVTTNLTILCDDESFNHLKLKQLFVNQIDYLQQFSQKRQKIYNSQRQLITQDQAEQNFRMLTSTYTQQSPKQSLQGEASFNKNSKFYLNLKSQEDSIQENQDQQIQNQFFKKLSTTSSYQKKLNRVNLWNKNADISDIPNIIYSSNNTRSVLFQVIKGCQIGCLICKQENQNELCLQCVDGYELNTSTQICEQIICEQYQYISSGIETNQNNQNCMSICGKGYVPQQFSQSCIAANICSYKYQQPTQVSQSRNITDIFLHQNGYLIVIYSNFFNYFDSQTGNYIRQQTFNSSIQYILRQNQTIYLLSDKNQIFEWVEETGQQIFLLQVLKGNFNINSGFILLKILEATNEYQQNIVFISTYQNLNKIIYFTSLNSTNQSLQLQYLKYTQISNNYIVLQNNNYQIQIASIQMINNQIEIKNIFDGYMCSGINGLFVQMIPIQTQQQSYFAIIFAQTNGFALLSLQNQSCQFLYQNYLQPLKMSQLQIYNYQLRVYQLRILILFIEPQSINFYDIEQNQNDFQFNLTSQSLDFIQMSLNQNTTRLYVLNQQQQLDRYDILYNSLSQNITMSKINSLKLYISNPTQLILIQSQILFDQMIMCIVSTDIQIVDLIQEQNIGVAINYVEKQNYHTDQINSIQFDEYSNLLLSCSNDGKIIIWNLLDPLNPIFSSQLIADQKCLQVLIFQSQIGIGLFTSSIILFDLYNSSINQIIQINQNTYSNIFVTKYFFFLIYNQQISVWKDLSQQIKQQTFTLKAKYSYISQKLRVYLMDFQYNMMFIDFDSNEYSFSQIQHKQLEIKSLTFNSIFDLASSQGSLLMFSNQQNQLFIYDYNLSLLYEPYLLNGNKTVDIYQYDDKTYFILLYAPLQNQGYPYYTSSIYLNQTIQFSYYYDLITGTKILNAFTTEQNQLYSKMIILQPQSPTSTIQEGRVYLQTNGIQRAKKIQTPNDQIPICVTNSQKTLYLAGSTTGSLLVIPENKDSYIKQIFQIPNLTQDDSIQFIQQNFNLGLIYYVTFYQVFTFNLHSLELISRIEFSKVDQNLISSNKIQLILVYQSPNLFLAFSNLQLILKNEDNLTEYQLSTLDQNSKLQYINGCYYDQLSNQVYVYGNIFLSYTIDLSEYKIISSPNQQQFQVCLFQINVVICQMNVNQVIIYNKQQQFQIIQIIQITLFQTFNIMGDEQYQNILIYSNNIEIYSFDGNYISRINQISSNIIQLIFTDQYIITFTSIGAFIFSRQSQSYITSFKPPGATLVKGFYFSEINTLAYITNEIRYGQVKFYSLDTLQSTGSVSSQFPDLGIGILINIFYDNANNAFIYADTYGNFYYTLYGSQLYVFNGVNRSEIILFNATNNNDISMIQSNKKYNTNLFSQTLFKDSIYLVQSYFKNNYFTKLFNKDYQQNLIQISNSYVQIQDLLFDSNQGNIIIQDIDFIVIKSSQFSNNIGIDGSCLYFQQIKLNLTISQSEFINNTALANGGAIYLLDSNNIIIQKNNLFKNNTAQIGGALRIQYTLQQTINNLYNFEQIKAQFQGNQAFIFGNNIGTYIYKYMIYQGIVSNLIYTGYMFKQNADDLILQNIKSGGNINLKIKFFDQSNREIQINKLSFINNAYPDSIMKEIQYYSIQVLNNLTNSDLQIKGDSISTVLNFDQSQNSFLFSNLQITGFPLQQISTAYLLITVSQWQQNKEILFKLNFRNCIRGEVYEIVSSNLVNCVSCSNQTYSLQEPIQATNITIKNKLQNNNNYICKKCPEEVQNSDEIIENTLAFSQICPNSSLKATQISQQNQFLINQKPQNVSKFQIQNQQKYNYGKQNCSSQNQPILQKDDNQFQKSFEISPFHSQNLVQQDKSNNFKIQNFQKEIDIEDSLNLNINRRRLSFQV